MFVFCKFEWTNARHSDKCSWQALRWMDPRFFILTNDSPSVWFDRLWPRGEQKAPNSLQPKERKRSPSYWIGFIINSIGFNQVTTLPLHHFRPLDITRLLFGMRSPAQSPACSIHIVLEHSRHPFLTDHCVLSDYFLFSPLFDPWQQYHEILYLHIFQINYILRCFPIPILDPMENPCLLYSL